MKSHRPQIYYQKGLQILLPALALFIGGFIYIVFRESEFVFFRWIRLVGLEHWLVSAIEFSKTINITFPPWIVYSLPNALWAFAYAYTIISIWYKSTSIFKFFWFGSIPVLVFGFEFLQYFKIIPGTFSLVDIFLSLLGIFLGIVITIKNIKSWKEKQVKKNYGSGYYQ